MKSKGPESWHAVVLRDEIEQLSAAVQMLAHTVGYNEGLTS